jgi:uncharacterized protein YjbI with pentapeptide repeats
MSAKSSNDPFWGSVYLHGFFLLFTFLCVHAPLLASDLTNPSLQPGANLQEIDLRDKNLRFVDLHGANLRGADLRGADLYGANLSGTNLCCARVEGANFTASNLTQANLSYIDFRGVALIEVTLTGAFFEHAIWTNGRRCEKGSIGKCLF